ncbi:hypothetical protein L0Y59_03705 [Candidatus Uhrbacteria bacterium]|nr:hypothetical protein [Candidatus Uhrbacteria bacterium]
MKRLRCRIRAAQERIREVSRRGTATTSVARYRGIILEVAPETVARNITILRKEILRLKGLLNEVLRPLREIEAELREIEDEARSVMRLYNERTGGHEHARRATREYFTAKRNSEGRLKLTRLPAC